MLAVIQQSTYLNAEPGPLPTNFAAYYSGASSIQLYDVTSDNDGNMYCCSRIASSPALGIVVAFNSAGTILWGKSYSGNIGFFGLCIDSVSSPTRVYCCSSLGDVVAYDSDDGTLIWKKRYGTNGEIRWTDIIFDSANSLVHVVGSVLLGTTPLMAIAAAYDTTGMFSASATIGGVTTPGVETALGGFSIGWNASQPTLLIVGGQLRTNAGNLVFVNSLTTGYANGSLHRKYFNVSDSMGNGLYVDASAGYAFAAWGAGSGSTGGLSLVGANASGAVQWKRCIQTGMSSAALHCDGTHIFITGATQGSLALMAEYDLAGAIQWQRTLAGGTFINANGMTVDGNNYLACGNFELSSVDSGALWSLPKDGSLTGTQGIWTYASAGLTEAASSFTDSDASGDLVYASATGSYSDALGSGLDAVSIPTLNKQSFG